MYRRYGDITWEPTDPIGPASVGIAERPGPAAAPSNGRRPIRRGPQSLPVEQLPSIRLDGVRIHAITEKKTIEYVLDELDAGRGGVVVTPNLDHVRRATRDLSFGALVAEADLVVADGMPLVWASRLQGTPLPQRVAGSDLISTLSSAAARRGKSIYLLGGAPGTAAAAAEVLKRQNPQLKIAGTYCPPLGFENDEREMTSIVAALVAAAPDIVFVALGSPKQENLIQRIRPYLPQAWWLGVGISFSFLCGDVRRAPRWMQKIGMEWIHRLLQDPKRLFHRYVMVGLPYGARLMTRALFEGVPNRLRRGGAAPADLGYRTYGNGHRGHRGNGHGHVLTAVERAVALSEPTEAVAPAPRRTSRRPTENGHVGSLGRLRAMILLGGQVRSSALTEACGRSVLDLPLDAEGSIFNGWLAQASELARHAGLDKLPVLVMVNRNTPEPGSASPAYYGKFRVERDLSEYRGTGGVLRDLAADFQDDDLLLVCNAAQVLLDPLAAIATALDRKEGDVTLVSHNDGTPSGVQLIAAKALKMIPESGFVDFKEQALPLIATQYDVTVLHCRRPTALPIRTLADYVVAMRQYHRRRAAGKVQASDPLAEDWMPAFGVVEQGATVDPRAHVHDSVVLKGATVEAGAVLVRSIVCPGAVVKKDRHVVDQLVRPEE
ncbi:MAG TPA: WecB/TagA/CpsF family glycosyltransferase [Tepidisphaeraceae bacterium]|nr:WecB/TagA/CpsF family glycosyltransferase [Tepidisphaeraceae bacterium]